MSFTCTQDCQGTNNNQEKKGDETGELTSRKFLEKGSDIRSHASTMHISVQRAVKRRHGCNDETVASATGRQRDSGGALGAVVATPGTIPTAITSTPETPTARWVRTVARMVAETADHLRDDGAVGEGRGGGRAASQATHAPVGNGAVRPQQAGWGGAVSRGRCKER